MRVCMCVIDVCVLLMCLSYGRNGLFFVRCACSFGKVMASELAEQLLQQVIARRTDSGVKQNYN